MSKMPWFRLYSDVLSDRKLARVCHQIKQPKALVLGVWVTLLALASESPNRGHLLISENMPLTDEEIRAETGLDESTFNAILDAFCDIGLMERGDSLRVTKWDKRQFKSDNSTERVQRHRERQKEQESNVTETLQEQPCNVIDPETDQDTDSDQDLQESPSGDSPEPSAKGDGIPENFQGWSALIQGSSNRSATLVFMHRTLFPARDPPGYSYVGKTAKRVGGAGRLAELLWQASTRPPTGDVLAYVQAKAKGEKTRAAPRTAADYEKGDEVL